MSFDPTKVKSLFSSVTFWGAVLTAVAMAFPVISAKFGLSTANTATDAQYITQVVGFVITVYGRLTATQPVSITGK